MRVTSGQQTVPHFAFPSAGNALSSSDTEPKIKSNILIGAVVSGVVALILGVWMLLWSIRQRRRRRAQGRRIKFLEDENSSGSSVWGKMEDCSICQDKPHSSDSILGWPPTVSRKSTHQESAAHAPAATVKPEQSLSAGSLGAPLPSWTVLPPAGSPHPSPLPTQHQANPPQSEPNRHRSPMADPVGEPISVSSAYD